MEQSYPKAWEYLKSYRAALRLRESRKGPDGQRIEPFNDQRWYRFGRHQNLDKQELVKLIVAETVPNMRVCLDSSASMYLNNVRVNGVIPAREEDPWFLLGILNAPVADFVFKRIAKVKAGGFFEANKQFIAPLPIPAASPADRAAVAECARALQGVHTRRRDTLAAIERRLGALRPRNKPETWLFPELKSKDELLADAPARLDADQKRQWAAQRYERDLGGRYDAITARLRRASSFSAAFADGELIFSIDGVPVISRIFLGMAQGEFIAAQWKVRAATMTITERTDGRAIANQLRRIAGSDNPAAVEQVIALERELSELDRDIARLEADINQIVYRLYALNDVDIQLVQNG